MYGYDERKTDVSRFRVKSLNRIVDITRKVKLQRANIVYRFGGLKNVGNVHAYSLHLKLFALSFRSC